MEISSLWETLKTHSLKIFTVGQTIYFNPLNFDVNVPVVRHKPNIRISLV